MESRATQQPPDRDAPSGEPARSAGAGGKLLVCVGPDPLCATVLRTAQRMAAHLNASLVAAYVETAQDADSSSAARDRLNQNLRLAETLGAEVVTLSGDRVAEAIGAYAVRHRITRIIVGKPGRTRFSDLVFGSLVDEIIRESGDIDVFVTRGEKAKAPLGPPEQEEDALLSGAYPIAAVIFLLTTLLAAGVDRRFGLTEVVMVYLLGIVLVALRYGRLVSLAFSALAVAAFDFLFVPPRFTFAVSDGRYIFTFIGMFVVGLVISNLAERVRWQAQMAHRREQRTGALYALTRVLSRERETAAVVRRAASYVADYFKCQAIVLLPRDEAAAQVELDVAVKTSDSFALTEQERGVARWVFEHNALAGAGSSTLPEHPALHVPLSLSGRCIGVVALRPPERRAFADLEQRNLLVSFCDQLALALERARWVKDAPAPAQGAARDGLEPG